MLPRRPLRSAVRSPREPMTARVVVVGAGLCGNLLAIMLARQGLSPVVYDRGPAPDSAEAPAGRSINLALAARGIKALEQAEAFAEIESLLLPMDGRIVHDVEQRQRFLAYGQHRNECIYSVSRDTLNIALYQLARDRFSVEYRFQSQCDGYDTTRGRATFTGPAGPETIAPTLLLAADGAGSTVRRSLAEAGVLSAREDLLDHGYKELTIPATASGEFALEPGGLHIWPRGGFMLIALPNLDHSFTATLFLPQQGQPGFDSLTAAQVPGFFREHFPDALGLMPDLEAEYARRPVGLLGTVHCSPWSFSNATLDRHVLLIGDAAHAIVPFHGQGMNAAFEDCAALDRIAAEHGPDWPSVIAHFESARRDNARAIAEMALENYEEMRDTVRDPRFEQRARLSFELERRFEGRFVPRYSMVMFHPEIGYAEAQRRGRIQTEILDRATNSSGQGSIDLELAEKLVETSL
jgi:kynurenine 3-monooxygenase